MKDCFFCKNGTFIDCDNNNHKDRRKSLEGLWDVLKCNNCGIEAIYPKPTHEELSRYYQQYYKDNKLTINTGLGNKYDFLRKIYHFFSGDIDPRNFIKKDTDKIMLDYGYGGATFLKYFHDKGLNIYGAEANDNAIKAGIKAGLKVKKIESFDKIPYDNNKFDIVYLMQVFEHLSDPRIFLSELNRVLKIDGELYLGLPNAKSIWKKVFKKNWVVWFPPFHIAHYHPENLRKLSKEFGLEYQTHWTKTPESWFRFSMKALIFKNNNNLEQTNTILDSKISRIIFMFFLTFINFFIKNNDCMVIKFKKVSDA